VDRCDGGAVVDVEMVTVEEGTVGDPATGEVVTVPVSEDDFVKVVDISVAGDGADIMSVFSGIADFEGIGIELLNGAEKILIGSSLFVALMNEGKTLAVVAGVGPREGTLNTGKSVEGVLNWEAGDAAIVVSVLTGDPLNIFGTSTLGGAANSKLSFGIPVSLLAAGGERSIGSAKVRGLSDSTISVSTQTGPT